jgi:hypothetical protein
LKVARDAASIEQWKETFERMNIEYMKFYGDLNGGALRKAPLSSTSGQE